MDPRFEPGVGNQNETDPVAALAREADPARAYSEALRRSLTVPVLSFLGLLLAWGFVLKPISQHVYAVLPLSALVGLGLYFWMTASAARVAQDRWYLGWAVWVSMLFGCAPVVAVVVAVAAWFES